MSSISGVPFTTAYWTFSWTVVSGVADAAEAGDGDAGAVCWCSGKRTSSHAANSVEKAVFIRYSLQERFGQPIDVGADGRVRHDDRENKRTNSRERGLGIRARVMRSVDGRI